MTHHEDPGRSWDSVFSSAWKSGRLTVKRADAAIAARHATKNSKKKMMIPKRRSSTPSFARSAAPRRWFWKGESRRRWRLPTLAAKFQWSCDACGHQWEDKGFVQEVAGGQSWPGEEFPSRDEDASEELDPK